MKQLSLKKILSSIAVYSIFLPIFTGIWNYKEINANQKKFLFYLVFSAFLDIIISALSVRQINNMPLFHLGTAIELLFFSYLYYNVIESVTFKKLIIFITIGYLIFNAVWLQFYGNIFSFNHETRAIQCLILVFFALSYFNFLSIEISIHPFNFFSTPMFWISIGVLLYFTGNFFLFSFYRYISTLFPEIWLLHSILNILANLLFMISFLCKIR